MKDKTYIIIILLIVVGGIIMTGIVHDRIVASRDKGLAVDWNADHKITGNVDQDQNQFLNAVIENRVDFPAGPVEGQIIYRTDLNLLYIYNGAAWVSVDVDLNKVSVYLGAGGQAIPDNFPTDIDWNSELYDLNTMHNPAVPEIIDIKEDGYYLVDAHIIWDTTAPTNSQLLLYQNAVVIGVTWLVGVRTLEINKVIFLSSGDTVKVRAWQWGDAAPNTIAGLSRNNWLTVTRLK